MIILSHPNLKLLTQFAIKARPFIGAVRVTEMFTNELYTLDILTKVALTGEWEIVELAKNVSYQTKIDFTLIHAISSYIYNINTVNKNDNFINRSKYLLGAFAKHLYQIKTDGASYRKAVEIFLLEINSENKTFSINLARKFYRYWKASNRQDKNGNKKEELILIDHRSASRNLKDDLDDEFFSYLEICLITQYTDSLFKKGLSKKDTVLMSKIAKLITIELRNEQFKSDYTYRAAIERTHSLFKNKEFEDLFLVVSREFYYLWLGIIPKILIAI